MPRLSPMILSAGAAVVLFAGTTVGILASQGRLGQLFGAKPESADHAGEHANNEKGAESRPENGEPEVDAANSHNTETPAAAPAPGQAIQAGAGNIKTSRDKSTIENKDNKEAKDNKESKDKDHGEVAKVNNKSEKPAAGEKADKAEHAAPNDKAKVVAKDEHETKGGAKGETSAPAADGHAKEPAEAPHGKQSLPARGATGSLVTKFTLPSPFTPEEMETLVTELREHREQFDKLQMQVAYEKTANERDRLDVEASYLKLEELRKGLDQQKKEVTDKVAELAKRTDALNAGEEKFVKSVVSRVKDLEFDKMQTLLFDFDMRIVAQVVSRIDGKKQGQFLSSLPADKRVALQKALESLSRTSAEVPSAKNTKDGNK